MEKGSHCETVIRTLQNQQMNDAAPTEIEVILILPHPGAQTTVKWYCIKILPTLHLNVHIPSFSLSLTSGSKRSRYRALQL